MRATGEVDHALSRLNRIGVIVAFGLVGPAIGTGAVLARFVAEGIVRPSADPGSIWPALAPALTLGYLFGLGPAFTAGAIYACVPRAARRIALSPLYGAAAVWVFYTLLPLSASAKHGLTDNWLVFTAGAVAALGCALLVRKLHIDGARSYLNLASDFA